MMKKSSKHSDPILYGPDRRPAVWITIFYVHSKRIQYIVRAGLCGDGEVLARAACSWGAVEQSRAYVEIEKMLNGYRFLSDLQSQKDLD